MAKKKSVKPKTAASKAATTKGVKKAKGRQDLPGQKVMPHGPKKIEELEKLGAKYAEAVANEERVKADAKEKVQAAFGAVQDALKKKRAKSYTVAGWKFSIVKGADTMIVRKANAK